MAPELANPLVGKADCSAYALLELLNKAGNVCGTRTTREKMTSSYIIRIFQLALLSPSFGDRIHAANMPAALAPDDIPRVGTITVSWADYADIFLDSAERLSKPRTA